MTFPAPKQRRSRRYLILGCEQMQGKTVVKVLNRMSDDVAYVYKRHRRWVWFSTDAPVKDQTLRRHAQQALDAQ